MLTTKPKLFNSFEDLKKGYQKEIDRKNIEIKTHKEVIRQLKDLVKDMEKKYGIESHNMPLN